MSLTAWMAGCRVSATCGKKLWQLVTHMEYRGAGRSICLTFLHLGLHLAASQLIGQALQHIVLQMQNLQGVQAPNATTYAFECVI